MDGGKALSELNMARFEALLDNAQTPVRSDFCEFINSGLRAARSCRTLTRSAILADVAAVLSCSADELSFMFSDDRRPANDPANDSDAPVRDGLAVPDFREMLQGLAAE